MRLLVTPAASESAASSSARSGSAPQFTSAVLQEHVCGDGDEVVFEATLAQGSEPLSISWEHDGRDVADSAGFKHVRQAQKLQLRIADAFPEDEGEYALVVANAHGQARITGRLNVVMQQGEWRRFTVLWGDCVQFCVLDERRLTSFPHFSPTSWPHSSSCAVSCPPSSIHQLSKTANARKVWSCPSIECGCVPSYYDFFVNIS